MAPGPAGEGCGAHERHSTWEHCEWGLNSELRTVKPSNLRGPAYKILLQYK